MRFADINDARTRMALGSLPHGHGSVETCSPASYTVAEVPGFLSRTPIRMYCRNCHYDLRGQENLRCPECGTRFDNEDAATFLDVLPKPVTVWDLLRSGRVVIAVILGIAVLSLWMPNRRPRHTMAPRLPQLLFRRCIGKLTIAWRDQQQKQAMAIDFDRAAVIKSLKPSYDGKDQYERGMYGQRNFRRTMSGIVIVVVPVAGYVLILLWLWRSRLRKPFVIALTVSTISLAASHWSGDIYRFFYPPSYSYVDDYVFVKGVNLLNPSPPTSIIGYERVPWRSDDPRMIIFGDFRLEYLYDDEFAPILEALGLELATNVTASLRPPKRN